MAGGPTMHGAHTSANPRNVPMYPHKPQQAMPAQRGGFFRALNFYRQTNMLASEFDGAVPTTRTPSPPGDELALLQDQQASGQALAASLFLDKLNLKLLERLWVAIKKNCMLNTASGRSQGVYEAISLPDFLRLAWQQMPHHSADDEQFLERLFRCVDRRKKGSVRTTDIATALVLICNADPIPRQKDGVSKLKTLFRIFDADDDSCLTHDEIFDMYLSIKVNDVTKTRQALIADITFDDELSLHEAKRLYELTIELLNVVSDFVIFEEFKKVFDERPSLISELLPGAFTLEWILSEYKPPGIENHSFGSDVRRGLIDAMRRGEEHLDLSKKRGRGMRIMQNCLNLVSHKVVTDEASQEQGALTDGDPDTISKSSAGGGAGTAAAQECSAGCARASYASRASLPKITSASKSARTPRRNSKPGPGGAHPNKEAPTAALSAADQKRVEKAEEEEDDDDDDSDEERTEGYGTARDARGTQLGHVGHHSVAASATTPRGQPGAAHGAVGKANLPLEALELPQLEVLPLNHTHAMRFRTMTLDAKTQQAYLRDKKDVNRSMKYQCLVCAVNHDFRLSKFAGAEHQHGHAH
jgi:hypothetical protein